MCCGNAYAYEPYREFHCADGSSPTVGSGYDSTCEDEWVFYTSLSYNVQCDTDADCFDGGNAKYDYDEKDVSCYKGKYGYGSVWETYGVCAYKYRISCDSNHFQGYDYATVLLNPILDNTCIMCPDKATCNGLEVECNDGYYLTNTDTPYNPICAACPGGAGITVHSDRATDVFECYATDGTDSSGTFEYLARCNYEE